MFNRTDLRDMNNSDSSSENDPGQTHYMALTNLPTLSRRVLLAGDPRIPRRAPPSTVSRGTRQQSLIIHDVTVIVKIQSGHSSLARINFRVANIYVAIVNEENVRRISHGMKIQGRSASTRELHGLTSLGNDPC